MLTSYRAWLEAQKYEPGTVTAQLHRVGRVEREYGDLDSLYDADGLAGVLSSLAYSTDDLRHNRPNPSKLSISGDLRTNLASYRDAIQRYIRFRTNSSDFVATPAVEAAPATNTATEDLVQERIGLERDMQASLRRSIEQLEAGLTIIDDGAERSVASGFIDITARDQNGAIVVIELKAGIAGRGAIGEILSYMGDLQDEYPATSVRGILIAAEFDGKVKAAARMVPDLLLRTYSVRFQFADVTR